VEIILRALTIGDFKKTLEWHNDEEIKKLYSSHPYPVTDENERQWYNKILTSNIPVTVFGIEERITHELIGIASLRDINLINRSAEFGMYVGNKKMRGHGISKTVTKLILEYAFLNLGLNRIYLQILEDNKPVWRLAEIFGFKREGELRESIFREGKFKNVFVYSMLRSEYDSGSLFAKR
jgi:RimJ/RimL family protein N-acetyltransferase